MSDVEPKWESQLSNPSPSGRLVLGPVVLWFILGSVTGSRSRRRRSCHKQQQYTIQAYATKGRAFYVSSCCAI